MRDSDEFCFTECSFEGGSLGSCIQGFTKSGQELQSNGKIVCNNCRFSAMPIANNAISLSYSGTFEMTDRHFISLSGSAISTGMAQSVEFQRSEIRQCHGKGSSIDFMDSCRKATVFDCSFVSNQRESGSGHSIAFTLDSSNTYSLSLSNCSFLEHGTPSSIISLVCYSQNPYDQVEYSSTLTLEECVFERNGGSSSGLVDIKCRDIIYDKRKFIKNICGAETYLVAVHTRSASCSFSPCVFQDCTGDGDNSGVICYLSDKILESG